ncbi:MAG TPA: hypothetical protein PK299_09040 [Anaerolineales bacterium]|nr:hypothetical protein [Anaerolineales bacterium]
MPKNNKKSQTSSISTPSKEKLEKLSAEISRLQDQLRRLEIPYESDIATICDETFDWQAEPEFASLFSDFSFPIYNYLIIEYFSAEAEEKMSKKDLGMQLMDKASTFLASEMTNQQKEAVMQALKQFKLRKFRDKELVTYLYCIQVEYFLLRNLSNSNAWKYFWVLTVVVLNNLNIMLGVHDRLLQSLHATNLEQANLTFIDVFRPQNFQRPEVQAYLATVPRGWDVVWAFEVSFMQQAIRHLVAEQIVLPSGFFDHDEVLDTAISNHMPNWSRTSQLIGAGKNTDAQVASQYLQQLESYLVEDDRVEQSKISRAFALFLWLGLRRELPVKTEKMYESIVSGLKMIDILTILARFRARNPLAQTPDTPLSSPENQ